MYKLYFSVVNYAHNISASLMLSDTSSINQFSRMQKGYERYENTWNQFTFAMQIFFIKIKTLYSN